MLDKLRTVTAQLPSGASLTDRDTAVLVDLQHQLEDYLVHKEPLRAFTAESLQQRIADRFEHVGASEVRRSRHLLLLLVGSWIGFGCAYGLGMLLASSASPAVQSQVALTMALSFLYTCIVAFYLSALKEFKPGLRKAYTLIVAGIVFTGVSVLQFPLTAIFDLGDSPWLHFGGFQAGFAISCFVLYLGVREFAKLINVTSKWFDLKPVLAMTALAALVGILAPHAVQQPGYEWYFDLSSALIATNVTSMVAAAVLVYKIRRSVTTAYSPALLWFMAMNILVAVNTVHELAWLLTQGHLSPDNSSIALAPFSISGMLMLQAGYTFKKLSRR